MTSMEEGTRCGCTSSTVTGIGPIAGAAGGLVSEQALRAAMVRKRAVRRKIGPEVIGIAPSNNICAIIYIHGCM
jgi:hypothetical protein